MASKGFTCGIILATIVGTGAIFGQTAEARDLTVTGWGGSSTAAQEKAWYQPYTEKTGINLLEATWSGGIGILRTKVQGGNADWDVVQVEADEVILGCEEGLFEKLDWNKLGGSDKFIPAAVNDCGVGNEVWTVLLGYDGDRLKDGPKSWADFWNLKKWPGKRGLRKTPKYTLEAALMADGVPPQDVYKVLSTPVGVDRAFKKLDEIKPNIVWYTSPSQVPELVGSGELIMSMGTQGRYLAANQQNKKNFKIVWNGNNYAVDFWVILKGSPNKEKAMDFIAYMSQPEVQARLPNYIPLGVTNKAAAPLIDPKVRPILPTAPENIQNAVALNAQFWVENNDQLTQRFNAWAAK